jgi:hypothetical protein
MNHWMWLVSLVGILSTAVVFGTDMFFLTIGRSALRLASPSAGTEIMGFFHMFADARMPIWGVSAMLSKAGAEPLADHLLHGCAICRVPGPDTAPVATVPATTSRGRRNFRSFAVEQTAGVCSARGSGYFSESADETSAAAGLGSTLLAALYHVRVVRRNDRTFTLVRRLDSFLCLCCRYW